MTLFNIFINTTEDEQQGHSLLKAVLIVNSNLSKKAREKSHSTEQTNSIYQIFPKADKCKEMWVKQLPVYIY